MNKKQVVRTMRSKLRTAGALRTQASFFGKRVGSLYKQAPSAESVAARMMRAFAAANLVQPEPIFFGTPLRTYVRRQQEMSADSETKVFTLPARSPAKRALAA